MPYPGEYFEAFANALTRAFVGPTTWFHDKIVVPNQKKYPWYHEKFRRVPTVDQCYDGDVVCEQEAQVQFLRDRLVDCEILNILRQRYEDCYIHNEPDVKNCTYLWDTYKETETNWFIKYGDLGAYLTARRCFMKQKHRLLWERRHGPVGTGMKENL